MPTYRVELASVRNALMFIVTFLSGLVTGSRVVASTDNIVLGPDQASYTDEYLSQSVRGASGSIMNEPQQGYNRQNCTVTLNVPVNWSMCGAMVNALVCTVNVAQLVTTIDDPSTFVVTRASTAITVMTSIALLPSGVVKALTLICSQQPGVMTCRVGGSAIETLPRLVTAAASGCFRVGACRVVNSTTWSFACDTMATAGQYSQCVMSLVSADKQNVTFDYSVGVDANRTDEANPFRAVVVSALSSALVTLVGFAQQVNFSVFSPEVKVVLSAVTLTNTVTNRSKPLLALNRSSMSDFGQTTVVQVVPGRDYMLDPLFYRDLLTLTITLRLDLASYSRRAMQELAVKTTTMAVGNLKFPQLPKPTAPKATVKATPKPTPKPSPKATPRPTPKPSPKPTPKATSRH